MDIEEVERVFVNKEFGTIKDLKNFLNGIDSQYYEWRLVNEVTGGPLYFMVSENEIKEKIVEFN